MTPPNNVILNILNNNLGIEAYWEQPTRIGGGIESYTKSYIAEYKIGVNGTWGNRIETQGLYASWNFPTVLDATYYIRIAAISTEGKTSQWVEKYKSYSSVTIMELGLGLGIEVN